MNDIAITHHALLSEVENQPLPRIAALLEDAFLHRQPPCEHTFFVGVQASLDRRDIAGADLESFCRALIVVARAHFAAASPREGLAAIGRAETAAALLPTSDLHRQLQTVKGNLLMDLGDFHGSFDAHCHALELARRQRNSSAEVRTVANLAGLFLDFGAHWDALKLGQRVLDNANDAMVPPSVLMTALNNMAEACVATHQPERGIELASRVVLQGPRAESVHRAHLCMAHILLTRLHLMRGRIMAAERELQLAHEFVRSTGFSRERLKVAIAQSLLDHEKGQLRQAVQTLKETLLLAGADVGIAKDALSALVTIYEKEGHPKSALRYLQRLAAMTGQVDLNRARERLDVLGLSSHEAREAATLEASSVSTHDFRLQTAALRRQLTESQIEVLERLAIAAEIRDDVTGLHCYRVGKWAYLIALEMGHSGLDADAIEVAARLHDIGKVGVPDHILLKPGKLTAAEYDLLKRHSVLGARLLSRSKTPQIRLAEKVAHTHHEHWDGSGYPQGLRGEAIPLAGRITAVADVFDALIHERPYKHAWPVDEALREIRVLSGTWFDPAVVAAFFSLVERLTADDADVDRAIEAKLKRSRIMRLRDYVLDNRKPSFDDSGTFTLAELAGVEAL